MNYFAKNLKLLRKRKGWSQGELATRYDVSRSTVSAYEIGAAEPNIPTLLKLSSDFTISIDRLIRQDLSELSEKHLSEIERGLDFDYSGKRLRILATTVTAKNEDRIELIPAKAKAGYTLGYGDPEFLADLPALELPFLSSHRKHRAFQIQGDSMPPIPDKSIVIGEYMDNWNEIKTHEKYIVVTREDGIVLKFLSGPWKEQGRFTVSSSNPKYQPYVLHARDIIEIWRYRMHLTDDTSEAHHSTSLEESVRKLQTDIAEIKALIKNN